MMQEKIFVLQGNSQLLDGGAMFGNAPKEMWKNWVDVDDKNRIPLACNCLLVINNQGKKILFEAGIGSFFEPKLKERFGVQETEHVLLKSLLKYNLTDKDIDYVVLSHLHFDHAGGILSEYNAHQQPQLLFPNAKFLVSAQHWARALEPHPRDKASFVPHLNKLLKDSGRLVLIHSGTQHELAPLVTFTFSQGHTPGLMISCIHLNDGPLVFTSDLIPGSAWVHVPISMGYDRYPELVIDEKKALLDELIGQNAKLFFTHDSKCFIGSLVKDESGKYKTTPFNEWRNYDSTG